MRAHIGDSGLVAKRPSSDSPRKREGLGGPRLLSQKLRWSYFSPVWHVQLRGRRLRRAFGARVASELTGLASLSSPRPRARGCFSGLSCIAVHVQSPRALEGRTPFL